VCGNFYDLRDRCPVWLAEAITSRRLSAATTNEDHTVSRLARIEKGTEESYCDICALCRLRVHTTSLTFVPSEVLLCLLLNPIMETAIDYGYEEHIPGPRSSDDSYGGVELVHSTSTEFPSFNRRGSVGSPFTEEDDDSEDDGDTGIDATEVSQSPSHHGCSTVTFDLFKEANDYPPMPADRQARKQRLFVRRGGAVHASLLKSAVMASMMDFDSGTDDEYTIGRRNNDIRRDSSISLQSLQDALRTETSPRKRARRRVRTNASEDTEDEDEANNYHDSNPNVQIDQNAMDRSDSKTDSDVNEASHLFDTMRMGGGINNMPPVRKDSFKREPPPRRVSRKTSYDSRVSDFDSDCGSDWED
jgi:hypothetical protein